MLTLKLLIGPWTSNNISYLEIHQFFQPAEISYKVRVQCRSCEVYMEKNAEPEDVSRDANKMSPNGFLHENLFLYNIRCLFFCYICYY